MLALIAENNKISAGQIAQEMDLSKKIIIGIISKLKDEEKIVRVGFERGGSWEIRVFRFDEFKLDLAFCVT